MSTTLYENLKDLPTLAQGQADDLKLETEDGYRYWLARTGLADGEPFEHTVHVERLEDGRWVLYSTLDGDAT
jgi:hypothetical protein